MAGAEAYQEIQLSTANIVGPVTAVAVAATLHICDKPLTVERKITHPVLSTAKIPQGNQRAPVVMFPAAKGAEESYRSPVLNHDLLDFSLKVYCMINISPHPIRGAIARDFIGAKPGGYRKFETVGRPGVVVPVRFEFFAEGRWNPLTETRCAIRDDRRWLTCIYQDPATGRMNIRSIPDRARTPGAMAE